MSKLSKSTRADRQKFTPSWDLASRSWALCQKNIEPILWLLLLPTLLFSLGSLLLSGALPQADHASAEQLRHALASGRGISGVGAWLLGGIWLFVNYTASLVMQLRAAQGTSLRLSACYREAWPKFWRIIGLSIVLIVVIGVGLICLIVPGLIFLRRYFLAPYVLIDQDSGIFESMRTASHLSKPAAGAIWGIIGVSLMFSVLANLAFKLPAVGIILSAVISYVYMFAPALRYHEIKAKPVAV